MRKPLRFWVLLLGLLTTGSIATWGGLYLLSAAAEGRPADAAPVSAPFVEPSSAEPITLPLPLSSANADSPLITSVEGPALVESPAVAEPMVSLDPPTGTAVPADWAKAPDLLTAVTEAFHGFSGTWSVAVTDLTTGSRWSRRGDLRYHPASTIKMPVTLFAMSEQRAGRLRWSDVIQYTEADFESPGGGAFETSPFGDWYPVENLVNRSLIYSNNVAVNMLGRHLGWQRIRDWTRTIDGELFREVDASPSTTALNELGWWRYLYQMSQDDPQTASLVLGPLKQVQYDGRIAAGLPPGVEFVHKFGSYDTNFHDGGIVWAEGRPYALVIMTNGATIDEADTYIPLVASAIHRVMR